MSAAAKKSTPAKTTAVKAAKATATTKSAAAPAGLSKERLIAMYREMLVIRRFEEKPGQLYGMGLFGGFCHLYIGQEAVVTGIQGAARPTDAVITTYRDHAHMLACGMGDIGASVSIATFLISGYSTPTLEVGLATFGFSGTS